MGPKVPLVHPADEGKLDESNLSAFKTVLVIIAILALLPWVVMLGMIVLNYVYNGYVYYCNTVANLSRFLISL